MADEDQKQDEQKTPKDILLEARERYDRAVTADKENRRKAMADLKFVHVPGEQWDELVRRERGNERPMYEFNKLRITIKRIVNDMRANRPQGKVRPVEEADKDTAETLEGLIRNIANVSDFDTITDQAAEFQVAAGMGAWRVCIDYVDDSLDQDITLEGIRNPFMLYADPHAQDPLKRDAMYWFLANRMSKDEYETKYPKKAVVDFDNVEFDNNVDWQDDDSVIVCEYWWKEPVTKTLLLLSNGETVDADKVKMADLAKAGLEIVKKREAKSHEIKMAIISGDAILEGPVDYVGKEFPFVMVFGENLMVDGRWQWFGITRFAKDSQRNYNYTKTAIMEAVALAPLAKFWATADQAVGHTDQWAEAHRKNFPFLMYNPDPKTGGAPPQMMVGPQLPSALIEESQMASEDIKAVTGIFDASLGQRSNETTGVAIRARQQQGEIAVFNYMDNLSKGIRRTWEILIDIIPKVIDTQRAVRILGQDGGEKYAILNHIQPDGTVINDLSRGKYDVAVTVGPSFATQRMEAAETYSQMAQAFPPLMQVAGDLIMKAQDVPYADQIAERMKALLPPQIQQMENQDKPVPPEVQAAMQQVQQAMQQVEQHGQLVQQAAQEAQAEKADADKSKMDVQLQLANLKVAEAQLATAEAQFKQLVAETQLKMGEGQQTQELANDRQALEAQIQQVLGAIQEQAAAHQQQSLGVLAQIHAAAQPQVVMSPPRPRIVRMETSRQGGKLVATPVYEDQQQPAPQPAAAPAPVVQ